MKIALIGMPNTGKTYWSKILEEYGFKRFGCDDLIEAKLELNGIGSVADWMDQPYTAGYVEASRKYLELEKQAMAEILTSVNKCHSENIVIDTTGSVIYLGNKILNRMKQQVKVVHFAVPITVKREMFIRFIKNPKPVIWGNSFDQKAGESNRKALARCYSKLLDFRTKRYQKLADICVDYHRLRNKHYTASDLMNDVG